MGSGNDCGIVLRHSLAEASELWRRCVVNRQTVREASAALGLDWEQATGALRLLLKVKGIPSPERLAAVAMRDWGLEDADIAEMWRRPVRWATAVRQRVDELREAEPIPEAYEYLDSGLHPDDPCPEEILRRAAEVRNQRSRAYADFDCTLKERKALPQAMLRCFSWNGRHASYLSVSPEKWAGR